MKSTILIIGLLLAIAPLMAQTKNTKSRYEKLDISMFPQPKTGFIQKYIQVPVATTENDLKVEIFVGKESLVDCNHHFMMGNIKEEDLQGWGYTYYTVESEGRMGSTLMGCPDATKTKKFVQLPPVLCRYNSKLPIVVYLPVGMELRYRFWRAENTMRVAKP